MTRYEFHLLDCVFDFLSVNVVNNTPFSPTQGDFLLKIEPPLGWSFGMIVFYFHPHTIQHVSSENVKVF